MSENDYDHAPAAADRMVPSPQALNTIERYDGRKDPNAWLNQIQETADLYNWSAAVCLKVAKVRLTDAAQRWAQARTFTSWDEFQEQLDHRFGETKETAIIRLERCFQSPGESPKAFADRFLQDADRAGRTEDAALVYQFIQRLQHDLRMEVLRQQPQSIDKAVDYCNYWLGAQGTPSRRYEEDNSYGNGPHASTYKPSFRGGYNRRPQQSQSGTTPQRPAFRDVSNRPRPSHHPFSPKPAAGPASSAAIDDLTQRFKKLEINLQQQVQQKMQEKDREIRTLRFALERKHQEKDEAHINFMGHDNLLDSYELAEQSDDIDYDLLAELMTKRSADDAVLKRMPAKRTAIDPAAANPYAPPKPAYTPRTGPHNAARTMATPEAPQRTPRQQHPWNTQPIGTSGTLGAAPSGMPVPPARNAPPTTVNRNSSPAADVADQRGKKLAAEICRSIKLDGHLEGSVPPQAVLTCLAGHLARMPSLVQLGRDIATQVDGVIKGIMRDHKAPHYTIMNMAREANAVSAPEPSIFSQTPAPAERVSTCRVMVDLNGTTMEGVLDTGATKTAIALDCLRRLNMTDHIKPSRTAYVNADGRLTAGKGEVPNMTLGLGAFRTLVNPTVTNALNYNILIGNDVLKRAKAVIDLARGVLRVEVDPETVQELPISTECRPPKATSHIPSLAQQYNREAFMLDGSPAPWAATTHRVPTLQPCFKIATNPRLRSNATATHQPHCNAPTTCCTQLIHAATKAPATQHL
jgi:hypothetical protein